MSPRGLAHWLLTCLPASRRKAMIRRYGTSPADLDAEQLRDWILKLIDRGLSPSSTNSTLAAFRFLYVETLGCPVRVAGLRNRKKPQALPRHMTASEVERLILATPDLRHRAAFIAAYGAGLRVEETQPGTYSQALKGKRRLGRRDAWRCG